jgi:hypothetical protein
MDGFYSTEFNNCFLVNGMNNTIGSKIHNYDKNWNQQFDKDSQSIRNDTATHPQIWKNYVLRNFNGQSHNYFETFLYPSKSNILMILKTILR